MFRLRLSFFIAVFFASPLLADARPEGSPICSALLYEDRAMLESLPPRLRPLVESARVRKWVLERESAWADFHHALDQAFAEKGKRFVGKIGSVETGIVFRKTRLGRIELFLDGPIPGAANSFQFLDFLAAELGWIAKARAQGKISELTIIGREVGTARFADTLVSLGFKPSRIPGRRCFVLGLVGGVGGFVGGRVFFAQVDSDVENGSIYEEQRKYYRDVAAGTLLGTGSAVALACFGKTGRDYSVRFHPDELTHFFD